MEALSPDLSENLSQHWWQGIHKLAERFYILSLSMFLIIFSSEVSQDQITTYDYH
jgi:hypothetical protein